MLELIGIDGLTQWDVGRQVKVDKDINMVHFSNRPYGYSKNVKVMDGVADVPDMFLTSCAPLHIWAYIGNFEKGYTKIEKIYEIKPKNRPEDYIYTPEDVKTWEKLQSEIGNLANLETKAKDNLVLAVNEAAKSGKNDYEKLTNLPQINGVELVGNKTGEELGLVPDLSGYATKDEIPVVPESLPNPNALTLIGAVNAIYDGSTAVSVEIPSGGGTDISLGLTSATVGQIIKVKAVDNTGKPTAWEAADISAGGGWELITDVTLTEDGGVANQFYWTKNDNGEDFEYRQCMVCISGTVIDGWPKGAYIVLNLYESNELTVSKASVPLSRLSAGAGGTDYKTTVEISIFGNLVRTIACGGSADTSSLIIRSDTSIDTFRSIKITSYGNNQWVNVPLAAGGRVVIYGRK